MIKISQRDISSEVHEFIERNSEFISNDVKKVFFTAQNIKAAAKKVVLSYLCKEIFGQTTEEIEMNLVNDTVRLEDFHSRVKKLEEVYGSYIDKVIEQSVTSKFIDEFIKNTQVNKDALTVIKSRLAEM